MSKLKLTGIHGDLLARSDALRLIFGKYFIVGCAAVFILLRVAVIFAVPIEQTSDCQWYLNRAISIAEGHGYARNGKLTAYWPVGYPGMLGMLFHIFGHNALIGQIANLVFSTLTFFLTVAISRLAYSSERAARIAALLFAVYPNNIAYTSLLFSEIYLTFLAMLATYLCISRRSWGWTALAGLVFGLAVLTKPQMIFVPAALLLTMRLGNDRSDAWQLLGRLAILYFTIASVVLPWSLRNLSVFGEFVPVSNNGGINLLVGNNTEASGAYMDDYRQRDEVEPFYKISEVAADRHAKALAIKNITNDPAAFLLRVPKKLWHLWVVDGEAEWFYQAGYRYYDQYRTAFRIVRAVNQLFYIALLCAAAAGIFSLVTRRDSDYLPGIAEFGMVWLIYQSMVTVAFFGTPRFHFPALPWVLIYGGAAIAHWRKAR